MRLKAVTEIVLIVHLIGMLALAFNIQPVKASGTIYIRADGSIEPPTAPIQRDGNIYTLTDNITTSDNGIVIERDNIILDGANYVVQGTGIYNSMGIFLSHRNNVTVRNIEIKTFNYGIWLPWSSNCNITRNKIINCSLMAIGLSSSPNNNIVGNNITNGNTGILLWPGSSNNIISENNVASNTYRGIWLESPNNRLRTNVMTNNTYNFGVEEGYVVSHFIQDIDTTNTIDSRPIYYWVNQQDMVVPQDAGYVGLVNSTRIIVTNLTLKNNIQGILLAGAKNCMITTNKITDNQRGILMWSSSNNTIDANNITANDVTGILTKNSSNNSITDNNVTNNSDGILLGQSSDSNIVFRNNVTANYDGILIRGSSNNRIYHNSFMDNTQSARILPPLANFWDSGYPLGGNYWSDYNGTDFYSGSYQNETGSDGMGDTPYIIDANNQDNYPLMNPWIPIETSVKVKGEDHSVSVFSNTTIEQIVATSNTLHFKSSGPSGETGYILVIFPMVNTTKIKVFIDGGPPLTPPPFPVINTNGTHYFIYFEFTLSTHTITLQFASAVPVGGVWVPIDKLGLLAPYMGLASLITIATISIIYVEYRKKKQT